MERGKCAVILPCLLAALMLTACGAQSERPVTSEPETLPEQAETIAEEPKFAVLPGFEAAMFAESMPEEDYAAFSAYLPVLSGKKEFRWVAGPHDGYPDGNWTPFETDLTGFHNILWDKTDVEQPPKTLALDRLAVQDVDGDGTAELVLLFQDVAYQYLVLHMEGDTCYGTSFGVRWFMSLRTNGIYEGSGGAGSSTYYRMEFRDEMFCQQELGQREEWAAGGKYLLDGESVTKEAFEVWQAENLEEEVTWYAPDGTVIPAGQ